MEKSVAEQVAESMVEAVKAHVKAALAPLQAEIADLTDRLSQTDDINATLIDRFGALPVPKDGKDGKDGIDGKDADVEAIMVQLSAIIDARMAALPKPENGKDGANGKDGIDGMPGIKGIDGRDGKDGTDGRNGVDALDLLVADSIDVTKAQQVGTWARHAGGLWVARSQKAGLESWECIVDGVDEFSVSQENERGIGLTCKLSSGKTVGKSFTVPVMIHRGVWEQREYQRGDVTTRDGSCWHAEKTTSAEPGLPSSKDDWTLIVKRGRDFTPPEQRRSNGSTNDPVRLR